MAKKRKKYLDLLDGLNSQENLTVVAVDDKPVKQTPAEGKFVAPVQALNARTTTYGKADRSISTTNKTTVKEEDDKKWYQEFFKGSDAFDDGYDFGDVTKTILGSGIDVVNNAAKGILGVVEGVTDLAQFGVGATLDLFGADKAAEKVKESAKKSWVNAIMDEPMDFYDQYSIFGDTTDAVFSGVGQGLTYMASGGLGAVGKLGKAANISIKLGKVALNMPTLAIVSGAGSGLSEAYNSDENIADWQAWTKGIGSGMIEGFAEGLFGMFGVGGSSLDDAATHAAMSAMKSGFAKAAAKVGVKAAGEGVEEQISYALNYVLDHGIDAVSKLTGDEARLGKEWSNAEFWENFFVGTLSAVALQGGGTAINITQAQNNAIKEAEKQLGRNLTAEEKSSVKQQISMQLMQAEENDITVDEQKVLNSVIENRVDGQTLTNAELKKIRQQALNDLKRGYVSTEDIENTLLANDNAEIAALKERLAQETDKKSQMELQSLIAMNEINKQTNIEKLIENNQLFKESYLEQGRKSQAFTYEETDNEYKKAVYEDASKIMNNTNRAHDFVETVAKIAEDRGTKYRLVNNAQIKELGYGKDGKTVNGLVTKDGEVLINVDSKKALNAVLGHETTHLLEGTQEAADLKEFAKAYAESIGDYTDRVNTVKSLYANVEGVNIENEITADIVGEYLFTDEQFINELSAKKPNIFQKIYNYVKHLYKMATAGSAEARQLEQLKYKFEKAYKNTSKQANTDIKYSLTDNQGRELTKAQQEHFKDSKVRDENGNLLEVYHGTNSRFNEYKLKHFGRTDSGMYGKGFYFTDEYNSAKYYGNNVKKQYLDIKNPLYIGKGTNYESISDFVRDMRGQKYDRETVWNEFKSGNYKLITSEEATEVAKSYGYDGIIVKPYGGAETEYIVFNPNQIKNVDNTNPTDNPDIRYSLSEDDYKMSHRPSTDYGDGSNFETNMPDVFEHPEWYMFGGDTWYKEAYRESWRALKKVRNNPDGEITIYRATIGDSINEGDWVSPSKTYAEWHNYSNLNSKGKVLELKVKAKDIRFAGDDLNEFGYFPNGVNDYSLSNFNEQEMPSKGSWLVRGKDVKLEVEETIAPLQETITELTEQVKTLQEQLAPINQPTQPTQAEIDNLIDIRDNKSGSEYASAFYALEKKYGKAKLYQALNNHYNGLPVETTQTEQSLDIPLNVMEMEHTPDSYTDEDMPISQNSYENVAEVSQNSYEKVESPFDNRDIDEVGKRNIKAYMYENPEVKPFFQEEAKYMLTDLKNSIKGERIYIPAIAELEGIADQHGGFGWTGTKRQTTDDIAYLIDKYGYSYAQIEEGLNKIIEDDGKENNAVSKRIEFMLDERLKDGYTDVSGVPIPPNQDYRNLLEEKAITEYYSNRFKDMSDEELLQMIQEANTDALAEQTTPDIPMVQKAPKTAPQGQIKPSVKEQYKAPEPKASQNEKHIKTDAEQQAEQHKQIAQVLVEEPATENNRNKRQAAILAANVLDKGLVFENLSLKSGNRELQGKWDYTLTSEARAQNVIGNGHTKGGAKLTKSLNEIRAEVDNSGLTQDFYNYMYHKLNVDRMTLEERYALKNKPVFGDSVTAEQSQELVNQYENAHPEFMDWAQDVYDYVNADRQQLVNNGVISQETADYWSKMYPHYVPIRRADKNGNAINVPLDTGRTGINAPVKKATGGSANILPLFDTMALRTLQTYRATAKNSFGIELMNTIDSVNVRETASMDEVIDSIDAQEELLQEGKNGKKPTFTVFDNGEKITFEITENMYDALKPLSDSSLLSKTNKVLNVATNIRRGLLTEYNPVFMLTNGIKDVQDILLNSQHAAKTYAKIPEAYAQMVRKGYWYQEYMENGGQQNSYFDSQDNNFKEEKGITTFLPLKAISRVNNFIELAPRLAEYIASREAGASIETAMLDAARVTTNFKAGGNLTKFLNRNGATFLNASVQGAMQQVRNVREANANGIKGWANLLTKYAIAGLPALMLNGLMWDDDEEYEELSDYVKQNYYIVAKNEDGTFVRIPKGRAVAVIQEALTQMGNLVTGDDEADLKSFLDLVVNNLAPNNPLKENIFAPITQAATNTAWYGGDLVPKRLQDLPAEEQYDESTDAFSKWLGGLINVSPYKINYVLDQYSGGIGDVILPMLTPEAENGKDGLLNELIAPLNDKFTTNSTLNNQNVTDFYDLSDELTTGAKKSNATDEDVLMNKYINSVKGEMSELYIKKREIQNSDLPDSEKYQQVLEVQRQINELAKEALSGYKNVTVEENYSKVEDREYRINNGEWTKLTDKQLEKQNEVTKALGITPNEYWSGRKEEYDYAYENPAKYTLATTIADYETYKGYTSDLYDLKADKDEDGKSISGSRKEKVIEYVNNLDIDYGQRLLLFKSEYNADDTYNQDIIDYLNEREDVSYEQMKTILIELGFEVDGNGNIYW